MTQEQGEESQSGDEDAQGAARRGLEEWVSALASQVAGKTVEMKEAIGFQESSRLPTFTLTLEASRWEDIKPYPGPVYHYTTYDALLAIVSNRSFRATKITHLNDASESHVGRAVVAEAGACIRKQDQALAQQLVSIVSAQFKTSGMFVLCASKIGNDLPQFDRYGNVSIELSPGINRLTCIDAKEDVFVRFFRDSIPYGWFGVMYSHREQLALAKKMVRLMVKDARRHQHTVTRPPAANCSCIKVMLQWYSLFVALCKHESYAKEEEVRHVEFIADAGVLEHRVSHTLGITPFVTLNYVDVPYILAYSDRVAGDPPVPFTLPPIKAIRLSASPYPDVAVEGVNSLFERQGYPPIDVQVLMEHYRPPRR